jgi:hypothetical protein
MAVNPQANVLFLIMTAQVHLPTGFLSFPEKGKVSVDIRRFELP